MYKISGFNKEGKRVSTQALLEKIYSALDSGETKLEIAANGQHDIGGPHWLTDNKNIYFKVTNPGQRCGSMAMAGTTIEILGSSSADVGWLNTGATIILKGDGGDTTAHSAAGGKIYVSGRTGTRTGALMKADPQMEPPQLWILKNTGSFPFEFMGGGIAVVCGVDSSSKSVLGTRSCVGMVGGTIYYRGTASEISTIDVHEDDLTEDDKKFLTDGMKHYLKAIDKIELQKELLSDWGNWHKLTAKSYDEKQLEQHHKKLKEFSNNNWIESGIFSDVLADNGDIISLVNTDKYRLHYPEWENLKYAAPCQFACPSYIPTQKRTSLLRKNKYKEAAELIMQYSPFPGSICGLVCPNPCMQNCTRNDFNEPFDIKRLGSFSISNLLPEIKNKKNKKVAIIGGGAGGLSAAWQLRILGYTVDVFEKEEKLGGKMSYAIPRERLPGIILDKELKKISDCPEININLKSDINKSKYEKLKKDYDSVIIAIGAHNPRVFPFPGSEKLIKGLDFLKAINRGEKQPLGKTVIVIGAGNAGMDVAWEAFEQGATKVINLDVQKPAAFPEEIENVRKRGGEIMWPVFTKEITDKGVILDDGTLVKADDVIIAVGEAPILDFLKKESITDRGMINSSDDYLVKGETNVFAIGDTLVPGLLTDAVGTGYQAARSVDAFLSTKKYQPPLLKQVNKEELGKEYYLGFSKSKEHIIEKEFDPDLESKTCMSCAMCRDCKMCLESCPQNAISRIEKDDGTFEYISDPKKCIGCGICAGVCPCSIWHMYNNTLDRKKSGIGD